MHKGRPFAIEQRLRSFGRTDLYSNGWPAKAYTMTTGTYAGSLAGFVTNPTPELVFYQFDPGGQSGYYIGFLGHAPTVDLHVGFHFKVLPDGSDVEGWVQTFLSGVPCLNEPAAGQNHLSFIWNAVSLFPGTTGGPHWSELRPTHVIWDPKTY